VVGFFINVGASRVCSSHNSHGIFLFSFDARLACFRMVCLDLTLVVRVFVWASVPVVSVLARFSFN
jgi:hypothetical protein